jgi:hypothetical protein
MPTIPISIFSRACAIGARMKVARPEYLGANISGVLGDT